MLKSICCMAKLNFKDNGDVLCDKCEAIQNMYADHCVYAAYSEKERKSLYLVNNGNPMNEIQKQLSAFIDYHVVDTEDMPIGVLYDFVDHYVNREKIKVIKAIAKEEGWEETEKYYINKLTK